MKKNAFRYSDVYKSMKERGWKIIDDAPWHKEITIASLELVEIERSDDSVCCDTIKKARKLIRRLRPNLGQRDAEYLLKHSKKIPVEWRGKFMIFPKTIWLDETGMLGCPYFYWDGIKWHLSVLTLDTRMGELCDIFVVRLVRPAKRGRR